MSAAALPRSLVRWAYRFVLGREPENEKVLDDWTGSGDLTGLREALLDSVEFASHAAEGFPERGGWIHGPVTEEAAAALLTLRDGAPPGAQAIASARAAAADLRALRRLFLEGRELRRRAPQRPRPRDVILELAGRRLRLVDAAGAAPALPGRDIAARHAALLRAAWEEEGAGRVILDAGAGIGLSALGFAAGAPAHAALLAHEDGLPEAAALASNLAGNGFTAARVRAVALDSPRAALAREGLARLDLLRLGGAEAIAHGTAWAAEALAAGALVVLRLDLALALSGTGAGPRGLLEGWCRLAPQVTAFDRAGEPYAVAGPEDVTRALHGALAREERADELVLSAEAGWRGRFGLGGGVLD